MKTWAIIINKFWSEKNEILYTASCHSKATSEYFKDTTEKKIIVFQNKWNKFHSVDFKGLCVFVCVCVSRSVLSNSVIPWTVVCQAPLSMGFFRQEYWNGLPFPTPGDLPDPEIEPRSSALQADSLLSEPPGKNFRELRKSNNNLWCNSNFSNFRLGYFDAKVNS